MQEVEKVLEQPTERQPVFYGLAVMQNHLIDVTKAALIIYVPFCVESVQELLKRIV